MAGNGAFTHHESSGMVEQWKIFLLNVFIDGIDKVPIFANGDGYSFRDYVMIYQGPNLASTVKDRFKRVWKNARLGLSGAAF